MPDANQHDQLANALNCLEHLHQAISKLPDEQKLHVEKIAAFVRAQDSASAKVAMANLLQKISNPPEELWLALADLLTALGETDIKALLRYIESGQPKPRAE